MVFNMWIIIMSNQYAVAIILSKPSRAAKSADVDRRRAISSMTAITSEQELTINIDDKNIKWTSKTIFSLDRNHRSKQKTCMHLLKNTKIFSHINTKTTFLIPFYSTCNFDTCSLLPGLLDITSGSWRSRHFFSGSLKTSSNSTFSRNFPRPSDIGVSLRVVVPIPEGKRKEENTFPPSRFPWGIGYGYVVGQFVL